MKKADMQATEEVYQMAKDQSAQEITELKEKIVLSNELGLMAGRLQAYKSIELLTEFLGYKQLAKIIDNKEFLKIPGITSIDGYLEALGIGRSTAFNNLKIARTLTTEEVQLLDRVGFTRRDLLNYSSLPEDARLEIKEGKVINLESASKEEIRDLIEQVLIEQKQAKEDADSDGKAKDRVLKAKEDVIAKQEKELAKLSREAKKKGLTPEEDTYIQRMAVTRDAIDGFLGDLDAEQGAVPHDATPRMIAAYLETVGYLKRVVNLTFENATGMYGEPAESESIGWVPPPAREQVKHPACIKCYADRPESCQTPSACCKGCPVGCCNNQYCAIDPTQF